MDLRDHDRQCKHSGAVQGGRMQKNQRLHWECRRSECPGGAAISIDYEAAAVVYLDDDMHGNLGLIEACARRVVDAALGLTDD